MLPLVAKYDRNTFWLASGLALELNNWNLIVLAN